MLLAIDVGNTNITLGVFQGERLEATSRIATDPRKMSDEYALFFSNMLPLKGIPREVITDVVMCSVVPPLTPVLEELCEDYFKTTPLVVTVGVKTGVRILYDNPRDVGTDRVVDAVAALRLYGGPVIVVDFGTATVFDAITGDGHYLGGAIAPGIIIAAEALFQNTSQLRRVQLAHPPSPIGKNTIHSMQSGLVLGYTDMVEGMVRRFKQEMGDNAKVIATGGLAGLIAQETNVFNAVNLDLTLIGLRLIYEMNTSVKEA